MERQSLQKITKRLVRIIDATQEPYHEWHIKGTLPVLDPKQCVVVEKEKL